MSKQSLAIAAGSVLLIAAIIGLATRSMNNDTQEDVWHGPEADARLPGDDWEQYDGDIGEGRLDEIAHGPEAKNPLDRVLEMAKPTEALPAKPEAADLWPGDREIDDDWGEEADEADVLPEDDAQKRLTKVEQPDPGLRGTPTPVGDSPDDPVEDQDDLDPSEDEYDGRDYDDDPTEPEDDNDEDDELPENEE